MAFRDYWKLAVPLASLALIGAAASLWTIQKKRAAEHKLAEKAKECRALAERGDAEAELKLSSMYYHGQGVPQDYSQALFWDRKAADQGSAKAQYAIGYFYHYGKGVRQDDAEALRWERKSADQGYAKAQSALGSIYYYGQGVPQDYKEAVRWYRKAADQGDAFGQDSLGSAYYYGKGVPQDYAEALHWYHKAAEQGDALAQDNLGAAYYYGTGVQRDYEEAIFWYHKAADQKLARAEYNLGCMYYYGAGAPQDYSKAFRWYRKAAAQGDASAQHMMTVSLSTPSQIVLMVTFMGSLLLLIGSVRKVGEPKERAVVLTALLGLLWVGLCLSESLYFGVLQAMSAGTAVKLAEAFLGGIVLTRLVFVVSRRGPKVMLVVSASLFLALNIFAFALIARYGWERFSDRFPLCYPAEFWAIGMALPAATGLWLARRKDHKIEAAASR